MIVAWDLQGRVKSMHALECSRLGWTRLGSGLGQALDWTVMER